MGSAENSIKGWRRPHRDRKLSEKAPAKGSEMASEMAAIRNAVPHSAGESPKT